MGRWEFSSGVADEPDPGDRPERSDAVPDDADRPSEQPEPGDRQQAWEESRTHAACAALDMLRAKVCPDRGAENDDTNNRRYDPEMSRLVRQWVEHENRWPTWIRDTIARRPTADQANTPDREPDPPGSWRCDSGRYLTPERHTDACDTVGQVREAEPPVSADLQAVERENTSGARLAGFPYRLKGDDRLKDKIASRLENEPTEATADVVRRIPDAIRYTFCIDQGSYASGYQEVKGLLESRGYEMYQSRNFWNNPEYKGINTRWVTPDGVRFEVQYHTVESFHAKEHMTHQAYERLRDPRICEEERAELETFQREVSSCVPVPASAASILDYRKEGFRIA